MFREESMAEAAARQLLETLGPEVRFEIGPDAQPHFVAQYFTSKRSIGFVDPRQHALTMLFVVPISGSIIPMGEAADFKWFDPNGLPSSEQWGFGQDEIVQQTMARWAKTLR